MAASEEEYSLEEEEYETDDEEEDDGDEDDEDDEDDDEEEDDDEPKLKYQRLGSAVTELLENDVATAMDAHDKFLALGTKKGVVAILDFNGNQTHQYRPHTHAVKQVTVDTTGEFIGSCSEDGNVVIYGLFTKELVTHSFGRPVLAMAFDPEYARKDTRQFVSGGRAGKLILNSKGFFGFGSRETVLHSGEGPIYAISWKGSLIAWANNLGVKIHDCTAKQRITYIERPKNSPNPDSYRCHITWQAEDTLLIGWADCLKIAVVKERKEGVPNRFCQIALIIQTDYIISGIASFGDYMVILAYLLEDDEEERASKGTRTPARPELRITSRANEEISSDALSVIHYHLYSADDYQLHYLDGESLFYIMSPHDIVMAKPCDLDDHIAWLMQRDRFEEALEAAERNQALLKSHKLLEIGEGYLNYLVKKGEVDKAAEKCQSILKDDKKLWENWVYVFSSNRQLKAISKYIPISKPTLDSGVYELVLEEFLKDDHERFLHTIEEWPSSLYTITKVIDKVNIRLKSEKNDKVLLEALAKLYTYNKRYDETLSIYLQIRKGDVFGLIQQHNLFSAVQDKVTQLLHFDEKKALGLLLANTHRIPFSVVVSQLEREGERYLLHKYLHALFQKDPRIGREFHNLQVELYADFDKDALLPFLRQSIDYSLDHALNVCKVRELYEEMVFILGRMGSSKEALSLIIDKLGSVTKAIEFVSSQNDDELWEDLIEASMNKEDFISGLLENIGGHVDPIRLISRIPKGRHIPGLRDRLVKIISDYNLEMSLREGCNEILKDDSVELVEKYVLGQRRGVKVDYGAQCAACQEKVMGTRGSGSEGGYVVFFCRHIYHTRCIAPGGGGSAASAGERGSMLSGRRGKYHCVLCEKNQQVGGSRLVSGAK